jgi:hypothetical protein
MATIAELANALHTARIHNLTIRFEDREISTTEGYFAPIVSDAVCTAFVDLVRYATTPDDVAPADRDHS